MVWCAPKYSDSYRLGKELALESGMNFINPPLLQKGSGIFELQDRPSIFSLSYFENFWMFHNYILSTTFRLYGDEASKVLSETLSKNLAFAVLFDGFSRLVSIAEFSISERGFFSGEIFVRRSQVIFTGMLPQRKELSDWCLESKSRLSF